MASIYEKILLHHSTVLHGCILAVTDDSTFIKSLRTVLAEIDTINSLPNYFNRTENQVSQLVGKLLGQFKHVLILLDLKIKGRDNLAEIKKLKGLFHDKCSIIGTTRDDDPAVCAYAYEMGADNMIVKPISMNSILQKLALTLRPDNAFHKNISLCKKLISEDKIEEASSLVDTLIKEKEDSSILNILKGDICFAQAHFGDAEKCYKKAASCSKMFLQPLQKLVHLYDTTDQENKKLSVLILMDKLSPHNHLRKISIGEIYLTQNVPDKAESYFAGAAKVARMMAESMVSDTLMDISNRVRVQNPELGIKYAKQAINNKDRYAKLTTQDLWMFNELGRALRKEGKIEESIKCFEKALMLADEESEAGVFYNIALANAQGKNYYRAYNDFHKALELSPGLINDSHTVPFNMASVCLAISKFDEAEEMTRRALEISPDFVPAQKLLDRIASERKTAKK